VGILEAYVRRLPKCYISFFKAVEISLMLEVFGPSICDSEIINHLLAAYDYFLANRSAHDGITVVAVAYGCFIMSLSSIEYA
jgi:hypothetical protein